MVKITMGQMVIQIPHIIFITILLTLPTEPTKEANEWLLDSVLGQHMKRIKVQIQGTRHENYLNGDYEGKTGRVLGAAKVGDGFEHTVLVEFEDGTARSVLMRYIVPVSPDKLGQQVLVIGGPEKGTSAIVRETPDSEQVVLSKVSDPLIIIEAARQHLAVLYN
jgi:transcription elongation factor SPT5